MKIHDKILGLLLITGIFLVLGMYNVPAVNVVAPANGTNHTATMLINVTYTNATDIHGVASANTTCYHNSSGTWTAFAGTITVAENATGTEASSIYVTETLTASLDDADISVNCSLGNTTSNVGSTRNWGITLDSTNPVVTLYIPLSSEYESFDRPLDYRCTINDGIDSSPTKTFNVSHPSDDDTSFTTLTTDSTDYLQFTDTDYPGDYKFSCYSSDYTGNTATKTATATIDDLGRIKKVTRTGNKTGFNLGGNNWLWIIIGILVIYAIYNRSK